MGAHTRAASPLSLDFDTESVSSYAQEEKKSAGAAAPTRIGRRTHGDAALALLLPSPRPISISCCGHLFHRSHAIDSVGAYVPARLPEGKS
jgi:hypothetical protein